MVSRPPVWGLALGSGSARGWAHLGVVRALHEMGIRPKVVTGCSVGAMVGAAWASRQLEVLERWALSLRRRDLALFLDISLGGSLIKGERLFQLFERYQGLRIERLPRRFGTVAAELETGARRDFTSGPLLEAVRASMSMPGLLPPVRIDGRWLVDGALVDPIPVRLCRQLGATRVIAVNLNHDICKDGPSRQLAQGAGQGADAGQGAETGQAAGTVQDEAQDSAQDRESDKKSDRPILDAVGDRLDVLTKRLRSRFEDTGEVQVAPSSEPSPPGLYDVMIGSLHVLQDRVARTSLQQHPPDVELRPRLGHIGMLEVYRGEEAMAAGRQVALEAEDELRTLASKDVTPRSPGP